MPSLTMVSFLPLNSLLKYESIADELTNLFTTKPGLLFSHLRCLGTKVIPNSYQNCIKTRIKEVVVLTNDSLIFLAN